MNWLDLAMIILAAASLASGIRRGFSRSGFGLIAVIAAFVLAAWLYPAQPAGFVVVFVAIVCAGAVVPLLLGRYFRTVELKWLDRVLGGAFGLTNAVVVSVIAVLAMMAFSPVWCRKYVARSTFAPYAIETALDAAEAVPDEMKYRIEESYQEFGRSLPPKFRKTISSPWKKI